MKKKDLQSLRGKTMEELTKLVKEHKLGLSQLGVKVKSGSEKNLKKANNLRREIAQTLTIIREKELSEKEAERKDKK